jgi:hypothetical protein
MAKKLSEYEKQRNAGIWKAIAHADKVWGTKPSKNVHEWEANWNKEYLNKVEELYQQKRRETT